ncbi:MAG: hypothetical protein NTX18_02930 [Cyanobium sp. LacPavin_0818_WC50_MAG_67_9]|nr:hypothetical protein [Cyanobium sp. LacPavin_0818_WC50_MAG_67_9]
MSPLRGIPTSRAYWELKAEQVLNRVFEPEKPIEVEVCDTPPSPAFSNSTPSEQLESIAVELQDLPPAQKPAIDRHQPTPPGRHRNSHSTRSKAPSRNGSSRAGGLGPIQHWVDQLGRRPSLILAAAGVSVLVVSGSALVALGVWNQSQQAIRQERNMLLIERLRAMGSGTAAATPDAELTAATPAEPGKDGEPPPPPPGEPWMEELASLPASSAPSADVLRVPVNGRITSPAPAASGSSAGGNGGNHSASSGGGGGGGGAPQLVGVVQAPGQSGSAIFQVGASSTSAAVGESIGSSGWRLRSANEDSAVIEKGGEQRRVSISNGF